MTARRKVPILATIVVAAAVVAMVALGIWQYQRAGEKDRLLALYERNIAADGDVAFPLLGPVPDSAMFRRSGVFCMAIAGWRSTGGRAPGGGATTRYIAECRTGAEGPGATVQMGTSDMPNLKRTWSGGTIVRGWISTAPDDRGLIDRLRGAPPPRAMLVLDPPVGGLGPNAGPDLSAIPNNHIAYMWQWFFFAAVAAGIYGLALRQRWARADAAPPVV